MSVKRYQPVAQCVEPSYQAQMIEPKVMEFSEGEYVLHSDYARLKAEVERLTERNKFLEQIDSYLQGANENAYEKRCDELEAEVERLNVVIGLEQKTIRNLQQTPEWSEITRLTAYCRDLQAEVERLRKAGDAMLPFFVYPPYEKASHNAVLNWNAAKEGKQP